MVKIYAGFWNNYKTYENVIIKCIIHITRKTFPNPDPQGEEDNIHFVITELHRLKIFQKWNIKRLTSKTKNTRQQFENYLYQRIWSILWNEYTRRKKRRIRFRNVPETDNYNKNTWSPPPEYYETEINPDMLPKKEKDKELKLRHKRAKNHPTIQNINDICSSPQNTTEEDIIAEETFKLLKKLCHNSLEEKIITYRNEGYSIHDIAKMTNKSYITIKKRLKNIHNRYNVTCTK